MKKFLIFFLCVFYLAKGLEISKDDTVFSLKEKIKTLPFKEKIKLQVLTDINEGKIQEANQLLYLYKILNTYPKQNSLLDNVYLLPENQTAVVVEKSSQRLVVLKEKEGNIEQIFSSGCITGKRQGDKLKEGDQRTPNGIYFPITFISSKDLSPIYGNGAFPLNYPNIIDRLLLHKTGKGIWLHATNDDNRPPFSSNGCVVVKNKTFNQLKNLIHLKATPVIIVDRFNYITADDFVKTRNSLLEFLFNWKDAWEHATKNGDVKKYLSFYSKNMVSPYGDFKHFAKHKIAVSTYKKYIDISIKNIYILKDGRILSFGNIYSIAFDMKYRSNNYNWKGKKILYIIKEGKKWKILAEENL